MATTSKADLERMADELAGAWVLVETNDGTFGGAEAARKVGTAQPQFAVRKVYEQVGTGKRRADGPGEDDAPGRMRQFNGELADKQRQLGELRRQIKEAR